MNEAEREQIITLLRGIFPDEDVTEGLVELYYWSEVGFRMQGGPTRIPAHSLSALYAISKTGKLSKTKACLASEALVPVEA